MRATMPTVGELLRQILELQANGDKAAADRFIDRYTKWDPALHEVVAKNMRATETCALSARALRRARGMIHGRPAFAHASFTPNVNDTACAP